MMSHCNLQSAIWSVLAGGLAALCAADARSAPGQLAGTDQIADYRLQWPSPPAYQPPWNKPDCRLQIAVLLRGLACEAARRTGRLSGQTRLQIADCSGTSPRLTHPLGTDQIADCRLHFCAGLHARLCAGRLGHLPGQTRLQIADCSSTALSCLRGECFFDRGPGQYLCTCVSADCSRLASTWVVVVVVLAIIIVVVVWY